MNQHFVTNQNGGFNSGIFKQASSETQTDETEDSSPDCIVLMRIRIFETFT